MMQFRFSLRMLRIEEVAKKKRLALQRIVRVARERELKTASLVVVSHSGSFAKRLHSDVGASIHT